MTLARKIIVLLLAPALVMGAIGPAQTADRSFTSFLSGRSMVTGTEFGCEALAGRSLMPPLPGSSGLKRLRVAWIQAALFCVGFGAAIPGSPGTKSREKPEDEVRMRRTLLAAAQTSPEPKFSDQAVRYAIYDLILSDITNLKRLQMLSERAGKKAVWLPSLRTALSAKGFDEARTRFLMNAVPEQLTRLYSNKDSRELRMKTSYLFNDLGALRRLPYFHPQTLEDLKTIWIQQGRGFGADKRVGLFEKRLSSWEALARIARRQQPGLLAFLAISSLLWLLFGGTPPVEAAAAVVGAGHGFTTALRAAALAVQTLVTLAGAGLMMSLLKDPHKSSMSESDWSRRTVIRFLGDPQGSGGLERSVQTLETGA